MWIKKLGYENQMNEFLKMVLDDNDIKGLPEEIRIKYKLYDCHTFVDTSEEAINKLVLLLKILDYENKIIMKLIMKKFGGIAKRV